MKTYLIRILLLAAAIIAVAPSLRAQTVDYVYGIEYGAGAGGSADTWYLDELAISVNGGGTATSYTTTHLVDLKNYVTGWDAAGTTKFYQCLNGLALDPVTKTLFFTYSWNNTNSQSSGTYSAVTYAFRYNNYAYSSTAINTLVSTARTPGTAGSPGDPGSQGIQAGWFTKGMFYSGTYYAGIQTATSDNLVAFKLGTGENSVTGTTVYTNISHGGADASQGGDIVVSSSGQFYLSGRNLGSTTSSFATETFANALNASGSTWNAVTSSTSATLYYYQLAGLGQIPRLYAAMSSGTFGQLTNFTNPSGTVPTFTGLSGSNFVYADLSDGTSGGITTPEPSTWGVGIVACLAVSGVISRRKRDASEPPGDDAQPPSGSEDSSA